MKQKGFTLLEVMISLFIGGLILGGVMFTYIGMKVTTKDTMTIGELQESGRLAINIMQRDIEQIGFWGTYYADSFTAVNTTVPTTTIKGDCSEGANNGSFPDLTSSSNFRSIYSATATGKTDLSCINDALSGSDILQLKFLEGRPLMDISEGINEMKDGNNYFIAELEEAHFINIKPDINDLNGNATAWEYSHHVYYISEEEYLVNNKKIKVPTLVRRRLINTDMEKRETIMEGVENMRFIFGLDTNADSRVDAYKSITNMAPKDWENRKGILTVQLFLLVRSLQENTNSKIKLQKYTLGEDSEKRELTFNDNYKRTVFTTTIRLSNVGGNLWKI